MMATFISETLTLIDETIAGYAESVFTSFAGPVTGAIQAMGFAGIALIAANALFQFHPVRAGEYVKWGIRYVVILAVTTSWAQFLPIYQIITNVPSSIAAALLFETSAPNLNVALDEMVTNVFAIGDEIKERAGTFDFGMIFASIFMWILGVFMATVAIIISAVAKIGLAMAVSLAPIFIASLLFRATSDLFTTWSRFTLGFALIPLVLAGVMGAVIGVGQRLMIEPTAMVTLADAGGFLIVVLASIIMMLQIPTMVNGLAGGIVATASGIREMQMAGNMAAEARQRITPQAQRAASIASAGISAEGGAKARVNAMLDQHRTIKAIAQQNQRGFQDHSAKFGRQTTWSERAEANRAGIQMAVRQISQQKRTVQHSPNHEHPDPAIREERLRDRQRRVR